MVYNIPADNPPQRSYGVIYNSEISIGGINYYNPEAEMDKSAKPLRFSLEKDKTTKEDVPVLILDSDPLKPEAAVSKYGKKEDSSKKLSEKEDLIANTYIVNIAGTEVNFVEQGIKKPNLSIQDKIWIEKAQYYFINAKENGVRVGSAPIYTTYDVLEALWATALNYEINPKRFLVQIYTESRFNPNMEGQAGERGIGQFKESTAKSMGFDWDLIKGGEKTYAYQAMAAARYVQSVGESAYNSAGKVGQRYSAKINRRLQDINDPDIPTIY